MNVKNNKRYKTSSEKIETAFLALMERNGYENVSISDICQCAGVNRSTFYAHYDDINDLVIKIEGKFAHSMAIIFDFGCKQDHNTFVSMFEFVKKNKHFYKAFLSIPYATLAEKNIKNQILSNMQQKVKGVFTSETELYYRASFFGAGIKEIARLWLERDCKETPEQMAQLLKQEYGTRDVVI